jgi:gamma-glutamylaminecyclotransferase
MSGGHRVFVYGTLKRGGSNHAYMAGQMFCGEARTAAGFCLIHLGNYPGLIASPEDREGVMGEVWLVDGDCLTRLDELEGVNEGLYRREHVPLQAPFESVEVDTYIYAGSSLGRTVVAGGNWKVSQT